MTNIESKAWIWRSAIGAVVGAFAKAVALALYSYGKGSRGDLLSGMKGFLFIFVFSFPLAVVMGLTVGAAVQLANGTIERKLGFVGRSIVGASCAGIVLVLFSVSGKTFELSNLSSWLMIPILYGDFGLTVGIVAGIFVGSGKRPQDGKGNIVESTPS